MPAPLLEPQPGNEHETDYPGPATGLYSVDWLVIFSEDS